MIKKINILLVVAFAAMLALKGVKTLKSNSAAGRQATAADSDGKQAVSQLSPCVCYGYWAGYSVENPISNRNGVLLDIVRAIFPNAVFRNVHGAVKDFAKILRENPKAVVVGFGEHPDLKGVRRAQTPLMKCPLVLMTQRTNPWRYKGPESLDSLRIIANEAFLDYKVIRELRERFGGDEKHLRIVPSFCTKVELAEMVEKGEGDAFVMAGRKNAKSEDDVSTDGFTSLHILKAFRQSDVIGNDGTFLYVSGLDDALAGRIIDEYEAGIKRIDANGERRRIFEYYGMEYEPIGGKVK